MNVHCFVTDTRNPQTRGQQIGTTWGAQIRQTVALYLDFFNQVGVPQAQVQAIGEASLQTLQGWCPSLAEELVATAEGAEVPLWQLASLNARTEILAVMPASTEGECSTAVFAPHGALPPRSIQTWDWHDSLVPNGLILQLTTAAGMTVKLFTEFGMLGKIGVNSAGLGLHFNILHHASDNGSAGVPVHAVARRILEEASSVDEAIALARSARVSASTVLTVFSREDSSPRAVSIEMSPAFTAVVQPDAEGWITHTNHFLDPELSLGERTPDASTTYARFDHVNAALQNMASGNLSHRADAMCGEAGEDAPICFHPDLSMPATERWETLLTIGIDTENSVLEYAAGNPKQLARNGYLRF
ncbi:C45 family autoproteolytic acyltransferase/hydolase [Pseudomonas sp. 13B_3.2_Bac1]|uniref:C45 family autoproteolytic acyltransferase/hydolase n=1 Tax=Pseudomonas sp. 13B_3.2_Bac1 TaxID=2971623 RepID=UPI0021C9099F|nr:C45 family peptidase [Pseudomonas sp. 13B_3.2_Bac1]MCU1775089.1 C45 family peptidase [Pseudomonas sp. 13B_3.2_Bac1]